VFEGGGHEGLSAAPLFFFALDSEVDGKLGRVAAARRGYGPPPRGAGGRIRQRVSTY
jgi:hypothetical protein